MSVAEGDKDLLSLLGDSDNCWRRVEFVRWCDLCSEHSFIFGYHFVVVL